MMATTVTQFVTPTPFNGHRVGGRGSRLFLDPDSETHYNAYIFY